MKNRIMRLTSRFLSVLLMLALLISFVPAYSYAEETNSDPVIVVSLGDSYSSGEGIEPFYGQSKSVFERVEDKDWLAHRSEKSWPSLLEIPGIEGTMGEYRADNGTVSTECEWYFGAVSGAETVHFKEEQQVKKYHKLLRDGISLTPYHLMGSEPMPYQLDYIRSDTDYVTLTIGGNDVDFTGIITTCVLQPDSLFSGNNGTAWFLDNKFNKLRDEIDGYLSDIKQVYMDIATKAPQAEIIVAGYPQLLSPEGKSKVITKDEAEIVNRNVSWFNDKLEGVIDVLDNTKNIYFVDVETEFAGHEAYSSDPWINPIWAGAKDQDINDLSVSSSYSIHPNEKGAKAYARCVNAKIQVIEENKAKQGTLSGKIVKASDRTTPVTDATIHVVANNSTISFSPNSDGTYSRSLPIGTYLVKVTADGYIEFNAYATIEENQTVYMETFLMVEGEETDVGTADGTITNALTGIGIEGVTLDVRSGWNNSSVGDVLTTITTNSSGDYTVTLPIGNYTLCASKDGYISTTINIVVQANMCTTKNGSMTPTVSGDNYRIVLTWGANPSDLDSHVVGTLTSGDSFHVYYADKSQYDGDVEVCNLDYDDTTSYGPETITLNTVNNSPYYYYIYDYSNSYEIASSGAQIKVYQGENLVATFNVPTNQGNDLYWNVFAIVNGELVVSNTITDTADLSYASATSRTRTMSFGMGVDVAADMAENPKETTGVEEETMPETETDATEAVPDETIEDAAEQVPTESETEPSAGEEETMPEAETDATEAVPDETIEDAAEQVPMESATEPSAGEEDNEAITEQPIETVAYAPEENTSNEGVDSEVESDGEESSSDENLAADSADNPSTP